jgi:hypothetical protein
MNSNMENVIALANTPQNNLFLRDIAHDCDVPVTFLFDKIHGRPSRSQGHSAQQALSMEEEDGLASVLIRLASQGRPASLAMLRQMASSLIQAREKDPSRVVGRDSLCAS